MEDCVHKTQCIVNTIHYDSHKPDFSTVSTMINKHVPHHLSQKELISSPGEKTSGKKRFRNGETFDMSGTFTMNVDQIIKS